MRVHATSDSKRTSDQPPQNKTLKSRLCLPFWSQGVAKGLAVGLQANTLRLCALRLGGQGWPGQRKTVGPGQQRWGFTSGNCYRHLLYCYHPPPKDHSLSPSTSILDAHKAVIFTMWAPQGLDWVLFSCVIGRLSFIPILQTGNWAICRPPILYDKH